MISRLNYKHIVALAVISVSAAAAATNLPSAAARFIVSPLRVEIAAARNFAAFQVDNNGDQVLAVQARIFAWTQVNGEDRYTPTSDVVATPSIVRIEAQATQHFKIVQRTKIDAGVEQRYRVVVDQLPTPTNANNSVAVTRLRVAIPIFVGREGASPANLEFLPENGRIRISNSGGQTAKIGSVIIRKANGKTHNLPNSSARYVLGGSQIAWAIPDAIGCLSKGSEITGTIDGRAFRADLTQTC